MAAIAYPEHEAPRWRSARPALQLVPAPTSVGLRGAWPPAPPAAPHRVRPSARVRRRRAVAGFVVTAVALGVVWALWGVVGRLGGGPLTAPGADPAHAVPAAEQVYVVQPGDTVWRIARELRPTGDVRTVVDRLSAQLHGRPLEAGEELVLNGR